jgi:phage-related protein
VPIFGENIGKAYVEIIASGDGLDESIRKEFHDTEPSIRAGGEEHGRTYGDAFDREVKKSWRQKFGKTQGDMFDDINRALTDSLARMDFGERFFKSPKWREFRTRLENEFGDAGSLAGKRLEQKFRDDFDVHALTSEIDRIGPHVRNAQRDIVNAQHSLDGFGGSADRGRGMLEGLDSELQHKSRDFTVFSSSADQAGRHADDLNASVGGTSGSLRDLGSAANKSSTDVDRAGTFWGRMRTRFDGWHDSLGRFNNRFDEFGDKIGSIFGKGSRSELLNVFGRVIEMGVKIPAIFSKAGEAVTGLGEKFAQEGAQGSSFMSVIGQAALASVAGIAALGAAIVVLSLLIGPVISLVFALAGILLALASSAVFAAAAVGGVLVGALGPLALALGVTILAVVGLKKHAGDLAPQLKELKKDFLDLAQVAKNAAFSDLPAQLGRLHDILQGLGPLVRVVGHGISQMINNILSAFESPAFLRFRDTFEKAMPDIMTHLGHITRNVFTGLFGLFRALLPLVQRFLGWLDSITGQFSRWINSVRGQNEVQGFFDRAAHSAQELGGFIAACVGLISELVSSGQHAGDTLFGDLTQKINEFRDFLAEPVAFKTQPQQFGHKGAPKDTPSAALNIAPPGTETRLQKFYDWIVKIARKLGDCVVQAGKLMGAFNDKDSQKGLQLMIGALTSILALLTEIQTMTGGVVGAIGDIGGAFSHIDTLGGRIDPGKWISSAFSGIGRILDNLFIQPFRDAWRDIRHLFGPGAWGPIHIDWGKLFGHLPSGGGFAKLIHLPTGATIAKLIGHVDVSGLIQGGAKAAGKLVGNFAGMSGRIFNKVKTNVSGMISGAASAAGKLLAAFAGMANKVFNKAKTNVSNMISGAGAAAASLVSAFGNVSSRILNAARTNVSGIISGAGDAANRLVDAFRGLAGRIVAAIGTITPHISIPHIPGTAVGGVFNQPQLRLFAEAGPEAVVPLDRPLSQVDPAVRMLSAIAQGKVPHMASGGVVGGKSQTNYFNVQSNSPDPFTVATETVNRLAAVGGY